MTENKLLYAVFQSSKAGQRGTPVSPPAGSTTSPFYTNLDVHRQPTERSPGYLWRCRMAERLLV